MAKNKNLSAGKKSHSNALVTQKGFACEMVARANYSYHRLPKSDFWVCPHFSKTPLTSFFACSIIDFQLKKVSLVKMAFDKKISGNYYYQSCFQVKHHLATSKIAMLIHSRNVLSKICYAFSKYSLNKMCFFDTSEIILALALMSTISKRHVSTQSATTYFFLRKNQQKARVNSRACSRFFRSFCYKTDRLGTRLEVWGRKL